MLLTLGLVALPVLGFGLRFAGDHRAQPQKPDVSIDSVPRRPARTAMEVAWEAWARKSEPMLRAWPASCLRQILQFGGLTDRQWEIAITEETFWRSQECRNEQLIERAAGLLDLSAPEHALGGDDMFNSIFGGER